MYYPEFAIEKNLYTNGDEFRIKGDPNNLPYTGDYYKTSKGEKFVGKAPSKGNRMLIPLVGSSPIEEEPVRSSPFLSKLKLTTTMTSEYPWEHSGNQNVFDYPQLEDFENRAIPLQNYTPPTFEDQQRGSYQRYFAKKANELMYLEISKDVYQQFTTNDSAVAYDLYEVVTFPYELSPQGASSNSNTAKLVERRNGWYGFTRWLYKYYDLF